MGLFLSLFFVGVMEMLQSCKYCGRTHPLGYACPLKPQKRRKNTAAQRFRNTSEWRQTRARVNRRDGHLCRLCLLAGRINYEKLSTHHIIPLEETMDYAANDDWCITLCDTHHEEAENGEHDREMLHGLAMEPLRLPERGPGYPPGVPSEGEGPPS